jgi:hypothetical protein
MFRHKFYLLTYILFVISALIINTKAQSAGPPMLTDDPGTPGNNNWEINTALTSSLGEVDEFELPLIDINYGLMGNIQLKIEFPFELDKDGDKTDTKLGTFLLGVKYRFIDENENFLDVSVYPQAGYFNLAHKWNEYILPVEIQKTLGKYVLCVDFGYHFTADQDKNLFSGICIGKSIIDKLELMTEIYFMTDNEIKSTDKILLNVGSRYELNDNFRILASVGTDLKKINAGIQKNIFAYLGLQTLL